MNKRALHIISLPRFTALVVLIVGIHTVFLGQAQYNGMVEIGTFKLDNPKRKKAIIPFEMVHNLILIPVTINGSDTLKFILDSGVTTPIITSTKYGQGLKLNYTREVELNGLGEGRPIRALFSSANNIRVNEAVGLNHEVLLLLDDVFHLSANMGTHVHGLIGYDIFKNFIVEINYTRQQLVLYNPQKFQRQYLRKLKRYKRKGRVLPIEIKKSKPYLNAKIAQDEGKMINVKLMVDCGASHAVSLYRTSHKNIRLPEETLFSYLGSGLNGDIYGEIGRVEKVKLGRYAFKSPIVTYPEASGIAKALGLGERNGSLGGEVLKRFKVIFNYDDGKLMLKPNSRYKTAFTYNMSGLEIHTPVPGLPIYEIAKVRKDSPAKSAGLAKGDQIVTINGVKASKYTLGDIIEIFESKEGRKVRIWVQRYGEVVKVELILKDNI